MKLWIDDIRPAPKGYIWCKNVLDAKRNIIDNFIHVDIISLDHDAGEFYDKGGDFIEVLNWMEELCAYDNEAFNPNKYNIKFHIHSMNPVGVQNMRAIIQKNGWKEV